MTIHYAALMLSGLKVDGGVATSVSAFIEQRRAKDALNCFFSGKSFFRLSLSTNYL